MKRPDGLRIRPESATASDSQLSIEKALMRCMQQAPLPFAVTRGADHSLVYANSAFCLLAGVDSEVVGRPITEVFSADERWPLGAILDRAFRDGVELLDQRIDRSSGGLSDWQCSVWPVIADDGGTEALGIEIRESSPPETPFELQRRVAEQMLIGALRERGLADDAEAARRRAAFLAEAGRLLAESVDQASTLVALSKLALPALGAWCIVDILKDGGSIERVRIYHPDPKKQKLARELEVTWMPEREDPFGAAEMLRHARPVAITEDIEATLAATAHTPENLQILRQLGIGALLTVPLMARNRLLGAITFVSAQHDFSYAPEDIQLAQDLATRGALALDNAQVYDLALVLKHSAETANRAKTAFLGAMSHELRTPLNAIGGYLELLDMGLRGPVTEDQRADFARMKINQQHLLVLITEILNFAKVESGRLSYHVSEINASDALVGAFELIEPLITQRGLIWDGITCDAKVVAAADPEKLTQILVNLFSNAIKFTPEGGHISAGCEVKGDCVLLSISDTGIGIPVERQQLIFEPFTQLKEGLTDRGAGVGLGLSISRDLARAMGGDLTVESSEGSGARFTLALPRAGATPSTAV